MNRRGFFSKLGLATAAFAILPSATTYERIWKPKTWILNPEYENARYQILFNERDFAGTWKFISFDPISKLYIIETPHIEIITTLPPQP
jgi:hypothetical protein